MLSFLLITVIFRYSKLNEVFLSPRRPDPEPVGAAAERRVPPRAGPRLPGQRHPGPVQVADPPAGPAAAGAHGAARGPAAAEPVATGD